MTENFDIKLHLYLLLKGHKLLLSPLNLQLILKLAHPYHSIGYKLARALLF